MRIKILSASVALAVLAPAAFAASGTFTFVTGDVSLTKRDGKKVAATRGTEVDPGDLIATGGAGMAQLSMIDQARLSLRPNSQFRIEGYQTNAQDTSGAVLNLLRGTLRTFTGLIATTNRDKFVMKTRVATVGIRGSGNILYACSMADGDCDESVADKDAKGDITVNHTIEGSHSITNFVAGDPNMPPQQGGPTTLITGPGQTVLVQGSQPPKFIPTPSFVSDTASNPSNSKAGPAPGAGGGDTRNFAPGDNQQLPPQQQGTGNTPVGNNGLGFVTIDASSNILSDPQNLRDIIIATSGPFLGQSPAADVTLEGAALRGYSMYAPTGNLRPAISGGNVAETTSVSVGGGGSVVLGRYTGSSLGFNGPGSGGPVLGSVHWIYGPSGYPPYLSDVLTGTATYTLVANTSPTNQANTTGTLGSATLAVNFTNRTLNLGLSVLIPATSGNTGGSWNLTANAVPFSLNQFFASTSGLLTIVNGAGISSRTNGSLSGSVEGSLVGNSLQAAILGYGISDLTAANANNNNLVTGVAAFTGPAQDGAAPYREGRISDAEGLLAGSDFSRNYSTTNRPDEVTAGPNGAITAFVAPAANIGNRASYAIGTAQVVQSGFDAETGMVWGRWGNGVAQVSSGSTSRNIDLNQQSLHYIFAGAQQGPVALPATGTATYDVVGSTLPTDRGGHVGVLGSATLDANFTNRTVSSTVNVTINNQTWIGSAPSMPIYRDQYFSATTGNSIPGSVNISPLTISCSPSCPQNPSGSFDGFFTGRNGQRAGMMYNMGGVNGAIAFGRRGG
ncbi:hypothetical protein DSM104443_01865 [Usitatibacter rugosus]|uniref:FecR protein domain-containing protein n=1 Tax=Usitatibacter rugosus TaxID=2732067 RepID=A0A6M4GUI6_9PROT|nr:FecR domain-containing protein [Usitatibacter rugosus]QJR10796.1 hypothetical protein DSM104443_01865 [Usitatibacter rugosus]